MLIQCMIHDNVIFHTCLSEYSRYGLVLLRLLETSWLWNVRKYEFQLFRHRTVPSRQELWYSRPAVANALMCLHNHYIQDYWKETAWRKVGTVSAVARQACAFLCHINFFVRLLEETLRADIKKYIESRFVFAIQSRSVGANSCLALYNERCGSSYLDNDVVFLPGKGIVAELWVQLIVPPTSLANFRNSAVTCQMGGYRAF